MGDALCLCRTVEDFKAYLKVNQGPNLGSRTNFRVMETDGKAWWFEVHNHDYARCEVAAAPEKYLANSNFVRSGKENAGAGHLRLARATQLFRRLLPGAVGFRVIPGRFTRDIDHHPSFEELAKPLPDRDEWIYSRDCTDRPYTAAAVVPVV